MVSRRRYLAALSAGVASLAGCSSTRTDGEPTGGPDPRVADPPQQEQTPASDDDAEKQTETAVGDPERQDPPVTDDGRLDIRDFGADVDGVTDDTLAVRETIAAAEPGETVWFPPGTTLVSTAPTEGREAISLAGDEVPPDLTLAGAGYDSVIRLAGNEVVNHKVFALHIQSGFRGLTMQNLRIDGQKDRQSAAGGHAIRAADATSAAVPCELLLKNLWVENCHQTGISLRHSGIVVDSCTVRGCRKHGISVSHQSRQRPDLPPFVVRNTYCTLNGKDDPAPAYGIDCSDGNILVENCVLENNAQGTKTTAGGIRVRYRRVRIHDNDVNGYIRAGRETTDRTQVVFEDVVSSNNGRHGFRFSWDTDYYVPTDIVATDNGADNVRITHNAGIDANRIWSNRSEAYGISSDSSVGGRIAEYHPYENEKGSIRATQTLRVGDRGRRDRTDLSAVPTAGTVGAGRPSGDDIESRR